jgi:hypothetical protein
MDRSLPKHPERTISITVRSPLEELLVERALCMAQEVRHATFQAPLGRVLDACENAAFDEARKLIRDAIQAASQEFIDNAEKKGLLCASVRVDTPSKTKARTPSAA